jgi:hypothetical protein
MDSSSRMRDRPSEVGNRELVVALDLAVEAARSALAAAVLVARGAEKVGRPFLRVVLRPPVVSPAYWPETWLRDLSHRGDRRRLEVLRSLSDLLDSLVPIVAQEVLTRIDLTEVVRRYVDLDEIVADVDLDAAVARVDIDAAARHVDVYSIIERLDLTRIVREHVDLDEIVAGVDLDAAAARLDIDAVIDRVDLVGIAEDVIEQLDLPEIIRESTGSMASDTLREVRMQGISGDEAVTRAIDRLRLRKGRRGAHATVTGGPSADGIPRQPEPLAPREP